MDVESVVGGGGGGGGGVGLVLEGQVGGRLTTPGFGPGVLVGQTQYMKCRLTHTLDFDFDFPKGHGYPGLAAVMAVANLHQIVLQ